MMADLERWLKYKSLVVEHNVLHGVDLNTNWGIRLIEWCEHSGSLMEDEALKP